MSLDIRVLPRLAPPLSTGSIIDAWRRSCDPSLLGELGSDPGVVRLHDHHRLAPSEHLERDVHYRFDLAAANTLSLSPISLDQWTDVDAEVEDFGKRLDPGQQREIGSAWKTAGYCYWIQSMGGRGIHEMRLLEALVRGLADATQGWIMVETPVHRDIPAGIYRLEELTGRTFALK